MENWINFDNLPRRIDGKISWKDCYHNQVEFCYREKVDTLYIEKYINRKTVSVLFKDVLFDMSIESLKNVSLGKLYGFAVNNNYKYDVGAFLNRNSGSIKVVKLTRILYNNGKSSKGYYIECQNCGYVDRISEANLERGDGCSVCSNHRIIKGINDLATSRPDIISMLKNKSDAYKNAEFSNKSVGFVCPKCGNYIGDSYIHNVTRFGLSCPYCSDGISFPNKLMSNLLKYLNIQFETEVIFDWCYFSNYYDDSLLSYGRYDFVIEDKKIIIEMDGGFGHGHNPHPFSKYTKEELIYRDNMKDELANKNGYKIIRIDCNYSSHNRLTFISNNILNSDLVNYYSLKNVDWNQIYNNCLSN